MIIVLSARGYPKSLDTLARHIGQPHFPNLLHCFLYNIVHPDSEISSEDVSLDDCPNFRGRIFVYHSAIARFFSPSDLCGAGGMYREHIRSNPNWHGEYEQQDTVFIATGLEQSISIGRVLLFFAFTFGERQLQCVLINRFVTGDEPDEDTDMQVVRPEFTGNGRCTLAIIPLNSITRAAHLLPVYGSSFVPKNLHFSDTLDVYRSYFVNKFADHHSHEFLFVF
jgi:hypothetical protein